jgi:hypothetical protein
MERKLLLRKKVEGKTRYQKPRQSLLQAVEILREMLGFEGWKRWPLKVAILDDAALNAWTKHGKNEGIYDVPLEIIGEEIPEDGIESETTSAKQERKRDLNLKKLMTLDLNDGATLLRPV